MVVTPIRSIPPLHNQSVPGRSQVGLVRYSAPRVFLRGYGHVTPIVVVVVVASASTVVSDSPGGDLKTPGRLSRFAGLDIISDTKSTLFRWFGRFYVEGCSWLFLPVGKKSPFGEETRIRNKQEKDRQLGGESV